MVNCSKIIDITAKNGNNLAEISLRENELIANLRILVAVRFEIGIDSVVLVFAGHVLIDVGTIADQGITSGVTVHVVFRQPLKLPTTVDDVPVSPSTGSTPPMRVVIKKSLGSGMLKPLMDEPASMRHLLESTPYMKAWLDDNPGMRFYIRSDSNLRELFSTMICPAKRQEVRRLHDVHMMRMHHMPGYSSMLSRAGACVRDTCENIVAKKYLSVGRSDYRWDYPQRGCENKSALPNPWLAEWENWNMHLILSEMTDTCRRLLRPTIESGDMKKLDHVRDLIKLTLKLRRHLNMHLIEARVLNLVPVDSDDPYESLYSAPPADGLSLIDFMSTNKKRWEEQFRSQLEQLRGLGHVDCHRNICALLMSSGDVQTAVEQLNKWNR